MSPDMGVLDVYWVHRQERKFEQRKVVMWRWVIPESSRGVSYG
jgi:hypothetical protein